MSWRSRANSSSAWRQCLAPLRQEADSKGVVPRHSLQVALESLRAAAADVQDNELVEDLSFLVQQLVGPQPAAWGAVRDTTPQVALCRLLTTLTATRAVNLHGPSANLVLSALRQWADGGQDGASTSTSNRSQSSPGASASTSTATAHAAGISGRSNAGDAAAAVDSTATMATAAAAASLPMEAMTALAALLPDHLSLLSEHERAMQLAALMSLLVPQQQQQQGRAAEVLELQTMALTALAACCGRAPAAAGGAAAPAGGLTADEATSLLSAATSLLQSCTSRSRPVEDAAHSRLYTALVRALQVAIGESRQAWVPRAPMLVEGLQRFLTYGVQASLTAAAAVGQQTAPVTPGGVVVAQPQADGGGGGGGGGGRYRPPHLRRRESQGDGGSGWSDSDVSDSEHAGGGGSGAGGSAAGHAAVVDRFRSSRVRLAVLSCIQAMAKSDPRAMHSHWSALLPLQAPLQPRPLTPHLVTVLLFDPFIKVRALAAATIASLLDGPAQRSILAVAEAKSMNARAPLRGFLTLSLSLGQLLLAAHAGLLHSVASESSALVLPGVLRALVVLMAASPYERLPPELLPETLKVLRMRWAALTAGTPASAASTAVGELGPIQAAYMACLAECFSTKHPIAGLATFLCKDQQLQPPDRDGAGSGSGSGAVMAQQLVRELLTVGRDASAAAVLRIEALAALKGLAAHYTTALPPDVWDDLRATVAMGLSCTRPAASGSRGREGPPSRSSSSSSLGALPIRGSSSGRADDRFGARASNGPTAPWASPPAAWGAREAAPHAAAAAAPVASNANSSPEDKAAQLSVKLLSDYLTAAARQYGINRTEAASGAGDGEDGLPGPPPSPGVVPLAAAVPRQQHSQLLSPVSERSEEEREAAVHRLAAMWQDAVAVVVPAATSHSSYMVRSASLACLGEVPEPVFSSLSSRLQHQLLMLLSDGAASDTVAAVRAAACKALGATAAFPAVLAQPQLSDDVTAALLPCQRDSVLSVRIAAGWAVANLCDAYRRRLEAAAAATASGYDSCFGDSGWEREPDVEKLQALRAESHTRASTSAVASTPSAALQQGARSPTRCLGRPAGRAAALQPHHYRQLGALCGAAVTAMQDADKVRANGVRAVGNLLSVLTPKMAPELAATGGGSPAATTYGTHGGGGGGGGGGSSESSPWRAMRHECPTNVSGAGRSTWAGSAGGGGSESFQLDGWLDSALTCLQSALTTGGMKVQWNACYAAHGLLRNQTLLAHPRVVVRVAPLLLLLVMLVRESANFKIRTHAAAALAALPTRQGYGDMLPDALLVVAGALESISNGGGAATAVPPGVSKLGGVGGVDGAGGAGAEPDGDGGEGRFPNYRYTVGLSVQLRATLLHLMALAQPVDARRVRDALTRRADFLHTCLREQLEEAVQPLRAALASRTSRVQGRGDPLSGAAGGGVALERCASGSCGSGSGAGASDEAKGRMSFQVELPADPFGLSTGRGASPKGAAASGGLSGLLAGLSLVEPQGGLAESSGSRGSAALNSGDGANLLDGRDGDGRPCLSVRVSGVSGAEGDADGNDEVRRAHGRIVQLQGPLRGFADLLSQLGPSCEPLLRDVRQTLAQLPGAVGGRPGTADRSAVRCCGD